MDLAKQLIAGVVAIGIITAFGLHASGLTQVGRVGFQGAGNLLNTAEKG